MREIKFRAWDKKQKRMMGGCCNLLMGMDGCLFWNFGHTCDVLGGKEFTDYILMQYTGLKDKNGKEIYEGDIFGAKERWFKPKVKYSSNKGGFIIGNLGPEILLYDYLKDNLEFEIIGNIYENPELLKEEE